MVGNGSCENLTGSFINWQENFALETNNKKEILQQEGKERNSWSRKPNCSRNEIPGAGWIFMLLEGNSCNMMNSQAKGRNRMSFSLQEEGYFLA